MLIICLSLLIVSISAILISRHMIIMQKKDSIIEFATIIEEFIQYDDGENYHEQLDTDTEIFVDNRVTIISSSGEVVLDTNADESNMDNHLLRDEVMACIDNAPEVFLRVSDTTGEHLIYYAVKIQAVDSNQFHILRVSSKFKNLDDYITLILIITFSTTAVVLLLSMTLSYCTNKKLVGSYKTITDGLEQIGNGNYDFMCESANNDMLEKPLANINNISNKIANDVNRINNEKQKLKYVVDNTYEGVILLNEKLDVILSNDVAGDMFNVDNFKDNFIQNIETMYGDLLSLLKNKTDTEVISEFKGKQYLIKISYKNLMHLIVFTDITTIKNYEKIKSEFFANASHELKTPITSISGFCDLAECEENPVLVKSYITKIKKYNDRLVCLISDMLKISTIEFAENKVQGVSCSGDLIANEVVDSLALQIGAKDINIRITGVVEYDISNDDLFTILQNLISNAIMYSSSGGDIDITMSETVISKVLKVKDNGIGIAKEYQDKVFERFFRVDKGRSKISGGTGLGLSIVKHIIAKYDGVIILKSELKSGSEFILEFPKVFDN